MCGERKGKGEVVMLINTFAYVFWGGGKGDDGVEDSRST